MGLGAAVPLLPGRVPAAGRVVPQVPADEEPGEHRVVGQRGAVAAQQAQVAALGLEDVVEFGAEECGGLPGVGRAGPVPVAGAGVAVVRQQPGDRPAVVAGVAARAERLGLVPPGGPVRPGVAQPTGFSWAPSRPGRQ